MKSTKKQDISAKRCPECGSHDVELVDTEETRSGTFVRGFACGGCYCGYKVSYEPTDVETYIDPQVEV